MSFRWKPVLVLCLVIVLASAFSPAFGQERVNMEFKQAPLVDVFQILGQLGGYNVLVDPSVSGQVSFVLNDLPVEEALDLVTRTTGYRYRLMGNTLVIASEGRLKSEFGTQDFSFVQVDNVHVDAARNLVTLVVPGVRSYVDQDLNLVVLFGLTSDLALAEQVLRQYDRQALTGAAGVATSVAEKTLEDGLNKYKVAVHYAEGNTILKLVRMHYPGREFVWDDNTRTLTGATTTQEWTAVVALVQEHDFPEFLLKGILTNKDQTVILVEYQGVITSLKLEEHLAGWKVATISDGNVEFTQGESSFIVRIGR